MPELCLLFANNKNAPRSSISHAIFFPFSQFLQMAFHVAKEEKTLKVVIYFLSLAVAGRRKTSLEKLPSSLRKIVNGERCFIVLLRRPHHHPRLIIYCSVYQECFISSLCCDRIVKHWKHIQGVSDPGEGSEMRESNRKKPGVMLLRDVIKYGLKIRGMAHWPWADPSRFLLHWVRTKRRA